MTKFAAHADLEDIVKKLHISGYADDKKLADALTAVVAVIEEKLPSPVMLELSDGSAIDLRYLATVEVLEANDASGIPPRVIVTARDPDQPSRVFILRHKTYDSAKRERDTIKDALRRFTRIFPTT